ncbi:hypothetical protein [Bordetella genomosp. 10]|uniref:hypothetical protein n=1 Tax=Bordetella genomosp. 10 TaxID=1416804 RepID=UPI0011780659|nr:hypothetical protein [Bordetella genomosp. 10]
MKLLAHLLAINLATTSVVPPAGVPTSSRMGLSGKPDDCACAPPSARVAARAAMQRMAARRWNMGISCLLCNV